MSEPTADSTRRSRIAAMGRSGLRRYPRHIAASVKHAVLRHTPAPAVIPAPDLSSYDLAAAWLGHATVLLRIGGVTVLTDPVFSHRIGMKIGPVVFGPHRLGDRHVDSERLSAPDVVLVSHAHFDHLDKPTLRGLASGATTVITARRTARLIPRGFARTIELDWGASIGVNGLTVSAVRPEHWGARTAVDRRRRYNAYILQSGPVRVLYAGDTAFTDAFNRTGPFDLAVFGIGAYDPWIHAHATPEQVWEMFTRAGAERLLPMHHSTFKLSDEHPDEPMDRLVAAAAEMSDRIVGRRLAEVWTPG